MKYITLLLLLLVTLTLRAQDLTLAYANVNTTNSNKLDKIIVTGKITNAGNALANESTLYIYFTTNFVFDSTHIVGKISIPTLAAGQSSVFNYIYFIPTKASIGGHIIGLKIDGANKVAETNESNLYYLPEIVGVNNVLSPTLKLPYPIVFIHGLNANSGGWNLTTQVLDTSLSYSFGGRLDFCLNADDNKLVAKMPADFIDFTAKKSAANLTKGDYYSVNFDVDSLGTYDVDDYLHQSNQSAIYKQGYAMSKAIKHILEITGAEKVIVVGHSMGGLATREYLSNTALWQADGKHHIAKLFTVGTPHGGSNSTAGWLSIFAGIDRNSEACRDLRYPATFFDGKYLFGGKEDVANNGGYNNQDINCNGTVGDTVQGLNNKTLPLDVAYTALFANNALTGGDGVVATLRANINNYGLTGVPSGYEADTLINSSFAFVQNHTYLTDDAAANMKGMDEPHNIKHAYTIAMGDLKMGHITQQSKANGAIDYDRYKFSNDSARRVYFTFTNLYGKDYKVRILSSDTLIVFGVFKSGGTANIDTSLYLNAGNYNVELSSNPTADSWKYPYYYTIDKKSYFANKAVKTTIADSVGIAIAVRVYPNPVSDIANLVIESTAASNDVTLQLIDIYGRIITSLQASINKGTNLLSVDVSAIEQGSYFCKINVANAVPVVNKLEIIR